MTQLETRILNIIQSRTKDNPISVPKLTELVSDSLFDNPAEVDVRQAVRSLIVDHGELIGSSTHKPSGYFLITDPEEIEKQYQKFLLQGLKLIGRGAKLKKIGLAKLLGQLSLELGNGGNI